jgi:hypothetical protein
MLAMSMKAGAGPKRLAGELTSGRRPDEKHSNTPAECDPYPSGQLTLNGP